MVRSLVQRSEPDLLSDTAKPPTYHRGIHLLDFEVRLAENVEAEKPSAENGSSEDVTVVDERQLIRIEAVHRGFLYQHIYGAICLLLAGPNGVKQIVVERDEDVEIVLPRRRIYVQIKTRVGGLNFGDVEGALQRFEEVRSAHGKGAREGDANFVIASNAAPSGPLLEKISADDWPTDVQLHWPGGPVPTDPFLPVPPRNVGEAIRACSALASELPFALLKPETLTWKLACIVMFASAGTPPRQDHSFSREELLTLFEQLIVQMQELPAPPPIYRAQVDEPPLLGDQRVRIVSGLSGAGKTAWVAEAALHAPLPVIYIDVVDTPGPALASAVTREVGRPSRGDHRLHPRRLEHREAWASHPPLRALGEREGSRRARDRRTVPRDGCLGPGSGKSRFRRPCRHCLIGVVVRREPSSRVGRSGATSFARVALVRNTNNAMDGDHRPNCRSISKEQMAG